MRRTAGQFQDLLAVSTASSCGLAFCMVWRTYHIEPLPGLGLDPLAVDVGFVVQNGGIFQLERGSVQPTLCQEMGVVQTYCEGQPGRLTCFHGATDCSFTAMIRFVLLDFAGRNDGHLALLDSGSGLDTKSDVE